MGSSRSAGAEKLGPTHRIGTGRAALLVLLAGAAVGCRGVAGSGAAKSEVRTVAGFARIDVTGALTLQVDIADGPTEVSVHGDDNLVPNVTTKVEGDTLKVGTSMEMSPSLPLQVRVKVPGLRALSFSGAGKADVKGVRGEQFRAEVSGAAAAHLSGRVDRVELNLSGAGGVDLYADRSLDADISGASSIHYGGHPPTVTKHISGVGVLRAK
ncbi:MAG: DUF2807 domain-containing protein [Deltaproteobacteria bacterium]|nr:DUF2807 domain-containing protein [Deltaproteobacteria bacterium]